MKSTHVYSNTTLQVLRFVYACSVLLNAHLQLSWDTPLERKDSVSEGLHLTELKSFCATWKTMILQYYSNVFKNTVWARIGAECDLRSGPVHVESQTAPLCSPLQCVTVSQLEFHKLLVFLVHACNVPSAHISVLLFLGGPAGANHCLNYMTITSSSAMMLLFV